MKILTHRDYGYIGKDNDNRYFSIPKGQLTSGYPVGILHLDVWYPLIPGNVVNAYTYDFPVRMKAIPNAVQSRVHSGDPTLVEDIIKAGKSLEKEGVRVICGACGYLANFQSRVADELDVPVLLSSLMQVPMIKSALKKEQTLGIICADGPSLTHDVFEKCGIDPSNCIVRGIGDQPAFSAILQSDKGSFDNAKVRKEVTDAAVSLVREHPQTGAILLECSDMPPYSSDVQRAVGLPVFDFITMIKWAYHSVCQKPYHGFI